ncbi:hypothetical protein FDP41_005218 [Naegleria fowleri]|uniref:Uncharacterized protein n=1 Tax=Naegleria fowleri TaxID=5763 RepID=A0A6A5BNN7_NAEFO|nr:uncharacterized protein FDP41_005218 [Naegleria fowleri]KAF0975891.1 hypothetical protein FDP41_005218 [Naegleria fowleri]
MDLSFSQYTWLYVLSSFPQQQIIPSFIIQHDTLIEYIEYLYKNYYFGFMGKDETLIYMIEYVIEQKKEIIMDSSSPFYIPILVFKIMIQLEQEILFYDILKRLLKRNEFNLSLSYQQAMYILKSNKNNQSSPLLLIHSLYQIHKLHRRKFLKNKLHQFIIRLKIIQHSKEN